MTLRIDDKWIWDFWFVKNGPDYHIFYLQAPRELGDEKLRHWNVSIGHAVSRDLINWHILRDALHPSMNAHNWDSASTWTGSIINHDSLWYMFYTGASQVDDGKVQRIGLATSTDLMYWQRFGTKPLLEADPKWYEIMDQELWYDQAWRDPWVFELDGRYHAFITARVNQGHRLARGVIGYAWSTDLISWKVEPPVATPGEFAFMEVPQLVEINGLYYLFFCVGKGEYSEARRQRPGVQSETGIHYMVSDKPFGPFHFLSEKFLLGDEFGSSYAGKVIRNPDGKWVLLATRAWTGDGGYIGEITDPLPLQVAPDGLLSVDVIGELKNELRH